MQEREDNPILGTISFISTMVKRYLAAAGAFLVSFFIHMIFPLSIFKLGYNIGSTLGWISNPVFLAISVPGAVLMAYLIWLVPAIVSVNGTSVFIELLDSNDRAYDWGVRGLYFAIIILAIIFIVLKSGTTMFYPEIGKLIQRNTIRMSIVWGLLILPMLYFSSGSFSEMKTPKKEKRSQEQTVKQSRFDQEEEVNGPHFPESVDGFAFPWESPPNITFQNIGDLSHILKEIQQKLIRPLTSQQPSYDRFGVSPARGILLYGPPGTGKTHLARAIAGELGYPYVELSGGDLKSKWLNESAENVNRLFREAETFDQCVIFIDEIDLLLVDRSDSLHHEHAQVVNEFLSHLERKDPSFVFIAATNRVERLDAAATRRGRFDEQFELGLPDHDARREIFQVQLREKPTDLSEEELDDLARRTEGMSGADIAGIVDDASRIAAENDAEAITIAHLRAAVSP